MQNGDQHHAKDAMLLQALADVSGFGVARFPFKKNTCVEMPHIAGLSLQEHPQKGSQIYRNTAWGLACVMLGVGMAGWCGTGSTLPLTAEASLRLY